MEVSGQLHASATVSPGKQLDMVLGGPQSCSGRGEEDKISQPPTEIEH